MRNLSLIKILGRFRALVGSTSTNTKASNPKPSSDAARTTDGNLANPKIIDKFNQELVSIKTYLDSMRIKLRKATEQINLSEGKLQQVVNRNTKLKVKETEDSKLWQGLDSEVSSTKTQWTRSQCDQLTEMLARQTEQAEEDKNFFEEMLGKNSKALDELNCLMHDLSTELDCAEHKIISDKQDVLQMKQEKEEMDQSYKKLLYSNDTMIKEKDSLNKQLESSIAVVQNIEVTENKLGRLNSEAEISASNINWLGKLPYEDCEAEASLSSSEYQLSEAKKQYDLMLEGKQIEVSKHLKESSLENDQVINEIRNKYNLEKIKITNAEKEKAEKLIREMEIKCNEKMSEKKEESERYLMHLETHGAMVARIQQDKEHNESTLQAYLKEELQRIQSKADNELRESMSLLSKEHELQIKSLRMKHEEECQRMHDVLELQNSKEEKQRGLLQLQQKGMGENQQVDQEVNAKKVVVRSLYFPFHQFRMLSSNSSNSIDERAPGNTATIILDLDNLSASKRSYVRAMNKVVAWCKSNTKVFDLSEYFGPGAEVFTTPAEGIFHLTFKYRERELTLFINGRNLYLMGWDGDRHGVFEIHPKDDKKWKSCIPDCKVIKMEVNYRRISKHSLGKVRIGPFAMKDAFEELYKCDGISYNDALDGLTKFAVNTSEAIRDQEVCKEIEDSFDSHAYTLDFRFDKNSGKDPLSANIRSYSFYSSQYLEYVDCMIRRKPLPEIISRIGHNVKSIHDLRNRIRVPLRDSYNIGKFVHEERPDSPVWCPPYPDGKGWISEQEEEE